MSQILLEIKPDLPPEFLHTVSEAYGEKPATIYQVLGSMVPAFALAILRHPEANDLLDKFGQAQGRAESCWQTKNLGFSDMPALIWSGNLQAVTHAFAAFASVKPSTVLALMPHVCTFWACFLQTKMTEKSDFTSESKRFLMDYSIDFQSLVPANVAPYVGLMPSERSVYLFTPPFNKNAWCWMLLILGGLCCSLLFYKYGRP